jgi:hypothetical protein
MNPHRDQLDSTSQPALTGPGIALKEGNPSRIDEPAFTDDRRVWRSRHGVVFVMRGPRGVKSWLKAGCRYEEYSRRVSAKEHWTELQ